MPENWEKDLLMEAEGLKYLLQLFQGIDGLLGKFSEEYGDYVDSTLLIAIECLRYDVQVITEGKIVMDKTTVPGILRQLDDVMDEVHVLQAGLSTRKGVENEDLPDEENDEG